MINTEIINKKMYYISAMGSLPLSFGYIWHIKLSTKHTQLLQKSRGYK